MKKFIVLLFCLFLFGCSAPEKNFVEEPKQLTPIEVMDKYFRANLEQDYATMWDILSDRKKSSFGGYFERYVNASVYADSVLINDKTLPKFYGMTNDSNNIRTVLIYRWGDAYTAYTLININGEWKLDDISYVNIKK